MDKLPQRWSHLLPQKLFDAFKDDFYAGPGNWKSFLDYEPTSPGGTQAGAPAGEETKTVALKGMRINGTVLEEYLGEENISAVVVPDHIETIGPGAFRGCELIRSVTIPENVRRIGRDAFRGCLRLEKVVIKSRCLEQIRNGGSIKQIGPGAFSECEKLKTVEVARGAVVHPNIFSDGIWIKKDVKGKERIIDQAVVIQGRTWDVVKHKAVPMCKVQFVPV